MDRQMLRDWVIRCNEHVRMASSTWPRQVPAKSLTKKIIRELMLMLAGKKAPVTIATAAADEMQAVLSAKLGAALVESTDPAWT